MGHCSHIGKKRRKTYGGFYGSAELFRMRGRWYLHACTFGDSFWMRCCVWRSLRSMMSQVGCLRDIPVTESNSASLHETSTSLV